MRLTEKGAYKKLRHAWNYLIGLERQHYAEAGHNIDPESDEDAAIRLIDECGECGHFYDAYMVIMRAQDRLWLAMGQKGCAPA